MAKNSPVQAQFLTSSPRFSSLPPDDGTEVAFAGRSNAGKSSVLNVLTGRKSLAKTSATPGKTRHINLFMLNTGLRLADLPGYGYAKRTAAEQLRWADELPRYITGRRCLLGVIIVMDIRHPLTESDREMLILCRSGNRPVHVLLNKADKLKTGRRNAALRETERNLAALAPGASVSLFSALKRDGIPGLKDVLERWQKNHAGVR